MQSEITDLSRVSKHSHNDTERLKATVDEKERVVLQLRHQLESKSEQLKASNKQSDDTSRERNFLKCRSQVSKAFNLWSFNMNLPGLFLEMFVALPLLNNKSTMRYLLLLSDTETLPRVVAYLLMRAERIRLLSSLCG